jgi:hypothetical protein
MLSIKELRERTQDGYNLAVLVPLNHDVKDLTPLLGAHPVLKEATGALGILRSLDFMGRMHGIPKYMAATGDLFRLWHLVFIPGTDQAVLHDITFKLYPEEDTYHDGC